MAIGSILIIFDVLKPPWNIRFGTFSIIVICAIVTDCSAIATDFPGISSDGFDQDRQRNQSKLTREFVISSVATSSTMIGLDTLKWFLIKPHCVFTFCYAIIIREISVNIHATIVEVISSVDQQIWVMWTLSEDPRLLSHSSYRINAHKYKIIKRIQKLAKTVK